MEAKNGFTKEFWKELIISNLDWISNPNQISEYDEEKHKKGEYWDDFIYLHDRKYDKIFVIKWLNHTNFDELEQVFNNSDFEVFCYSKTRNWTIYNSYKPILWWIILNLKSKIKNILDLWK